MKLERVWAMPNKHTFSIKPIKKLLKQEVKEPILDLFPYPYQRDALESIRNIPDESYQTVLYDPPYSPRQLKELYNGQGMALTQELAQSYWTILKREVVRILKPGGKCIKFGWNSCRIGKGFEIERILLVSHGKEHNDTIVTIQKKMNDSLSNNMGNKTHD